MSLRHFTTTGTATLLAATLLAACGASGSETLNPVATAPVGEHAHDEMESPAADARRIEVTTSSFDSSPARIEVDAGEDIVLALAATDVLHDFTVDGADMHVAAAAGQTTVGGMRSDEPGTYTAYCSVPGHREACMTTATVVVDGVGESHTDEVHLT